MGILTLRVRCSVCGIVLIFICEYKFHMSWWMGAGLGFLRGGPLGAVIGGTIEHFLGKKLKKKLGLKSINIQKQIKNMLKDDKHIV